MTPKLRRYGLVLVVVLALVGSGCVTTQPTIQFQTDNQNVFQSVSTSDSWGTSSIQASVTLAPGATTSEGVTSLSVVTRGGSSFYTTTVEPGQTSVTLPLPVGSASHIVATNTVNGTTVGVANTTVTGTTVP